MTFATGGGSMGGALRAGLRDARAHVERRLFDAALATGLRIGQDRYTRFVILGRGRTGSNLLRTSLASHPDAVVFGELFNGRSRARGEINWGGSPGYRSQDARSVALREQDAVAFLDRCVFAKMPSRIRAVGFKLFYYHAQEGDWQRVWDPLAEQEVRVIHLMRRNLLQSQVSAIIAEQTGRWISVSPERDPTPTPITLPYERCVRFFERSEQLHEAFASRFDHVLTLYYEDLVADPQARLGEVQQYLGLPIRPLSSPLRKQQTRPLHEVVLNHGELERRFAGTRWAWFFEPSGRA